MYPFVWRREDRSSGINTPLPPSSLGWPQAYFKKCRVLHPDKNHGDPNAATQFVLLQQARPVRLRAPPPRDNRHMCTHTRTPLRIPRRPVAAKA